MSETNTAVQTAKQTQLVPRQKMESLLQSDYWQDALKRTLGENAGTFATSLVELFSEDKQLAQCDPKLVIKQAMLAGAVNLPISKAIGFAYLTVFKNKGVPTPTLIISTRGYVQLAQRSGKYRNINDGVVYEGQIVTRNFLTGEFELREERTSDKVIGFFAYIKTTDGFEKTLYMSVEQVAHHAKTYSASIKFDKEFTEEKLIELIQKTAKEGPIAGVTGWKGDPLSMSRKTVLKQLIYRYGPMSVNEAKAIAGDDDGWDNPSAEQQRDELNSEQKPVFDVSQFTEAEEVADDEPSPFDQK